MDKSKIAEKLIALRGEKSQADVAKDLGVSQSVVSSWENDGKIPRDDMKIRIADYYNVSVAYLFFET